MHVCIVRVHGYACACVFRDKKLTWNIALDLLPFHLLNQVLSLDPETTDFG